MGTFEPVEAFKMLISGLVFIFKHDWQAQQWINENKICNIVLIMLKWILTLGCLCSSQDQYNPLLQLFIQQLFPHSIDFSVIAVNQLMQVLHFSVGTCSSLLSITMGPLWNSGWCEADVAFGPDMWMVHVDQRGLMGKFAWWLLWFILTGCYVIATSMLPSAYFHT